MKYYKAIFQQNFKFDLKHAILRLLNRGRTRKMNQWGIIPITQELIAKLLPTL